MINTIEQAISFCHNETRLCGLLTELNIDTSEKETYALVSYKGIVDIGGCCIKFYGKISSNVSNFRAMVDALSDLNANILTISKDGDIKETKYADCADMVYIIGLVKTYDSVSATYIHKADHFQYRGFVGKVNGYVNNIEDNTADILIINEYHNIIHLSFADDVALTKGGTYEMYLDFAAHESKRPYMYIQYAERKEDIAQDVVEQALMEHQIYLSTFEQK